MVNLVHSIKVRAEKLSFLTLLSFCTSHFLKPYKPHFWWRRSTSGVDDHQDESRRSSFGNHNSWRSWGKNQQSSSIKWSILSNIVKSHTKASLSMWQVKDHVSPRFSLRIPTVCVLLSTLFQKRGQLLWWVVYYESIKREVKRGWRFIMNQESESYRQNLYMRIGVMKDLKTKAEESIRLGYTGLRHSCCHTY